MGTLIQPSFSKGEVNPELFGRVDTAAYKTALATARNTIVRTYGGIINRPGLQFVGLATSMSGRSRLRHFRFNTGDVLMLEFSAFKMRIIRDGVHVLETPKAITGATQASPVSLTIPSHGYSVGDHIEIAGVAGMTRLNARRFEVRAVPDANTVQLTDIIAGAPLDGSQFAAYVSGGTAARVYTLATVYAEADLPKLKFVQSADVMTITHPSYPEQTLTRFADTNWAFATPTFAPGISAPTGVSCTPVTTGTTTASYVVTAISSSTGEESLPSSAVTITNSNAAADNTISWAAQAGVSLFSVYKSVNGVFGFVGDTPGTSFEDTNISPQLSTTPPQAKNPFTGPGTYPAAAAYYQQRLIRGGSSSLPDTTYYSQTGNFYNMSVSTPSQASDAITAMLTSQEVNQIRHFVPLRDLLVFTAGSEWRINANGQGFAADTMQQLPQSAWGCSHLEPIVVGQTILFVPDNQVTVRSLEYTFTNDAYTGQDLTLLSGHLFGKYTLTAWAYGRSPDPVVFGVRSDGSATALTFQEDQQITAWCRWDTSGTFEDVDVMRPTTSVPDDVPYFVISRTINGRNVRTIERLHTRRFTDVRDAFFVDAGLSYDNPVAITGASLGNPVVLTAPGHGLTTGQQVDIFDITWAPTLDDVDNETQPDQLNGKRYVATVIDANTISVPVDGTGWNVYMSGGTLRVPVQTVAGLDHLEGRTVAVLADGNVVSGLTVTAGAITLPNAASRIHAGLKFISDIETMNLEAPQGTIQGKYKRTPYVTLRFNNSRGLFVGQDANNLQEIKQRQFEDMGDPTALFSGDETVTIGTNWDQHGRIFCRQRYPLPMDILAIIPDVEVDDT